jgi:putative zinc finger/helix-turn-helix YgiT family protein
MEKRELRMVETDKTVSVRGEDFVVPDRFLECQTCHEKFFRPDMMIDSLDLAYRAYRKKHGWFQPEEIKAFRKTYGLSQKELSSLLGFGEVTLSRYESGALQDKAHEISLRLVTDPNGLRSLVEMNPGAISPERLIKIRIRIEEEIIRRNVEVFRAHIKKESSRSEMGTLSTNAFFHSGFALPNWKPSGEGCKKCGNPGEPELALAA